MKNQNQLSKEPAPEVQKYFVHTANVPQKINNPSRENSPSGEDNTLKSPIPTIKEIRRQIGSNKLTGWQREDIHYDKPDTWPKRSRFWPQL